MTKQQAWNIYRSYTRSGKPEDAVLRKANQVLKEHSARFDVWLAEIGRRRSEWEKAEFEAGRTPTEEEYASAWCRFRNEVNADPNFPDPPERIDIGNPYVGKEFQAEWDREHATDAGPEL